jgi:hypothetical protein
MQHLLESHPYIQELLSLDQKHKDRKAFHFAVQPLLKKMGDDKDFISQVVERNFRDKGYLEQKWSLYNIPFFYIYETADFNLKIHLFVPLASKEAEKAASCIHHHNNYMLSSYAMHGSGYESFLFEKEYDFDEQEKTANFKITKHFFQKDWPVSFVDAWEPHLVFNPTRLSATLILWSPDKKRVTDSLRQNPLLKSIKKPLRKIINLFGLSGNVGIASKTTYQYYPENGKIKGILEDEYFEPTRNATGKDVDVYSIQTVFRYLQETKTLNIDFLKKIRTTLPDYYQPFVEQYIAGDEIPETFAKAQINIPAGGFTKEEVLAATHA